MSKLYKLWATTMIVLLPLGLSAQDASGYSVQLIEQTMLVIVVVMAMTICLTLIYIYTTLRTLLKTDEQREREKQLALEKEKIEGGYWNQFWNRVNATVPVVHEAKIETSHEYDGIRELDNRLPPWWLYGFYFTIIFGLVYLFYYHVAGLGSLQHEEYVAKMDQADAEVKVYLASLDNLIDESNVTYLEQPSELESGNEIFQSKCAVCHANDGGGGVGPNFTDEYWLHGGDIQSIFKTVKYGVPAKGMISWATQLSPKQMQQVSSYVYSLQGTKPANPKEPQGEIFKRDDDLEVTSDSTSVELVLR